MRKLAIVAALVAALATPARATLTTTNSVITYVSNGATTVYSVPFKFLDSSHLVVQKIVSAVTTTLVLGTDYTVTGAASSSGGTVTLTVAVTNGGTVKIARSTPRTQPTNLRANQYNGGTVEGITDRLAMQIQELNDGTFTQLVATPITTAQASIAAPTSVPNSTNTNTAGSSASFAAADHVHALAVGPMLSATSSAGQSIPNNAATVVVFGTVGRDTDSAYNAATGRFTVPVGKGGDYLVAGGLQWNAAPGNQPHISIGKNGTEMLAVLPGAATPGGISGMNISAVLNCAAGDLIDIRAYQNSGGSVALNTTAVANFFTLKRIQ